MSDVTFVGDSNSGAMFDESRKYRYSLWRRWHEGATISEMAMFVGVNPSTADETEPDNTVTRCINFAKDWGFGGMIMTNLFAYRETNPKIMKAQAEPVGELNDQALKQISKVAGKVVCCWGVNGIHRNRCVMVKHLLKQQCGRAMFCLGTTKDGHPNHPLYLPSDTKLVRFE